MELALVAALGLIIGAILGFWVIQGRTKIAVSDLSNQLSQKSTRVTQLESAASVLNQNLDETRRTLQSDQRELSDLRERMAALESTNKHLTQSRMDALAELEQKSRESESKLEQLRKDKEVVDKHLTALQEQEPIRIEEYNRKLDNLNVAYANHEKEREREANIKAETEVRRLKEMRETWSRHETEVEQKMRLMCQELGITYVDKEKYPFGGKPDNAIYICDEYIVFDSKSPQGDDLENFPSYIRREAEAAKKYTKNETVKKDIFLVVPTNAIGTIENTYMPLGANRVHVVTVEALQPILIQLKKIEEYEFAEKLSPEDREKIVTVLGRMAHGMKRRLQVDHFFANEFISVLTDAENLPEDILKGAQDVERTSKLNPPVEKRAKRIETEVLVRDQEKLVGKVEGQEIHLGPELNTITTIPLHKQNQK